MHHGYVVCIKVLPLMGHFEVGGNSDDLLLKTFDVWNCLDDSGIIPSSSHCSVQLFKRTLQNRLMGHCTSVILRLL